MESSFSVAAAPLLEGEGEVEGELDGVDESRRSASSRILVRPPPIVEERS